MVTAYVPDLGSEYVTGDQPYNYRKRRGTRRYPSWGSVEAWRRRWTREKVLAALDGIAFRQLADTVGRNTGFGTLTVIDEHGLPKSVPDLRGLDLALLPPEERQLPRASPEGDTGNLDLAYYHFEGARLTDLDLSNANLARAFFQKATLRRAKLTSANLAKAHLEDADIRDAVLDNANLGHIRYTTDGFWYRGSVLMETHLGRALYVDPVLERTAKDQYYIYVLRYRNRNNPLGRVALFFWRWSCNYGNSFSLWAAWSLLLAFAFAAIFHFYLGSEMFSAPNLPKENFGTMVYFSIVTFTTLGFGDVAPRTPEAAWWVTAEVITGYVMLGGLISIFATKIARRS